MDRRLLLAPALWLGLFAAAPTALAEPEPELIPVADHFRGKVSVDKKGVVTIRYDFSDALQLEDFTQYRPFQARDGAADYKIEVERLHLTGTGSMRHRAVFEDRVEAHADFTPTRNRDFGFAITERSESDVFTLYCVYDRYFSASDGVFKPQNMIIKFLPRAARIEADGLQDWRYCGSYGPDPQISRGRTYRVAVSREGLQSRMDIDDWTSKGREAGRELVGPMVAVYGHDADVVFDDLVIRGKLASDYVKKHKLDLTPTEDDVVEETVEAGPTLTPEQEAAVRTRIGDYPRLTKPADLAELLRDTSIPVELRQEAVERAKLVEMPQVVPFLLDGLYSEHEDVRGLSWDLFSALVKKKFTYRANGDEASRSRAIKKIIKYLEKNAADYR